MSHQSILELVVHHGYIGIFSALMLGIIGLPVPDEVLMTFCGYLVSEEKLVLLYTILSAVSGSICGMTLSYFIGYKFGKAFLYKHGSKLHISPEKIDKIEQWFERFGKFTVTIGYFIPGVRHFSALSAGVSKWPYRIFISYAFPGSIIWTVTFISFGCYVGKDWMHYSRLIHKHILSLSVTGIILIAAYLIIRYKSSLKKA